MTSKLGLAANFYVDLVYSQYSPLRAGRDCYKHKAFHFFANAMNFLCEN